jgi:hypothetical protein
VSNVDQIQLVVTLRSCEVAIELGNHAVRPCSTEETVEVLYEENNFFQVEFGRDENMPAIAIDDIVAVREDLESIEFVVGRVYMFSAEGIIIERIVEEEADWFTVVRADVVVLASGAVLRYMNSDIILERSFASKQYDAMPRRAFETFFGEAESRVASGEVDPLVIVPLRRNGLAMPFTSTGNVTFDTYLMGATFRSASDIVPHNRSHCVARAVTFSRKSRMLEDLLGIGAVLICLPEHQQQFDLLSNTLVARWFVAASGGASELYLDIAETIMMTEIDTDRRQKALIQTTDAYIVAMESCGRMQQPEMWRQRLHACLAAGAKAKDVARQHEWPWAPLQQSLLTISDLCSYWRPDENCFTAFELEMVIEAAIPRIVERQYEVPSDEYAHVMLRFYQTNADLHTRASRNEETQKMMNPNATLSAAVRYIYQVTGQRVHRSTVHRRMTARRSGTDEEKRHNHLLIDARPYVSERGDTNDFPDSHPANATVRAMREMVNNVEQRHAPYYVLDSVVTVMQSVDDKARMYCDDTPVKGRNPAQWCLVARDAFGGALKPLPTLHTISSGQVAARSVVSHAILVCRCICIRSVLIRR